jgi:hypothetical protein
MARVVGGKRAKKFGGKKIAHKNGDGFLGSFIFLPYLLF